jgi:hypothetical protein
VRVTIRHGAGDPAWAKQAATEMAALEGRFNQPTESAAKAQPVREANSRGALSR